MKLFLLLSSLFFSLFSFSSDNSMLEKAIEAAQANRIKDPSSPVFSCMLSQWEGEYLETESKPSENKHVYNVFGYERFLACYRSATKAGAKGELGVDTEKRKVPNGTKFRAKVICENNVCQATWLDSECCYDLDLNKY